MAKSRSRGLLSRRRCEAVVQCTSSKTKTGLLSSNRLSPGTSATRWLPPATPAKASWELSTSSSSRSPLQRSPRTDPKDRRTAPRSGDAGNASGHQRNHSASIGRQHVALLRHSKTATKRRGRHCGGQHAVGFQLLCLVSKFVQAAPTVGGRASHLSSQLPVADAGFPSM